MKEKEFPKIICPDCYTALIEIVDVRYSYECYNCDQYLLGSEVLEQVSRNHIKGKKIKKPKRFLELLYCRKSLYVDTMWRSVIPAAFLQNMQAVIILKLMSGGKLYAIKKMKGIRK